MMAQPLLVFLLALFTALSSSFSPIHRTPLYAERNLLSSPRHTTAIFSATRQDDALRKGDEKLLQCQGCNRKFDSRNALFRHIRGDDESLDCPIAIEAKPQSEVELLVTAVIRYGYLDDSTKSGRATNEVVANMIHEAFIQHVNTFLDGENSIQQNLGRSTFREGKIFGTTALSYSSAAIMRQPALRQDEEVVGAASEVLSFNYRLACKPATIASWKEYANSGEIQMHLQAWLDNESPLIQIQLHHMDALVPRSSKFYAERSATQRSYTFLLPVKWILPGVDDEAEGNDGRRSDAITEVIRWGEKLSQRSQSQPIHQPRAAGQKKLDSPAFILKLKQSLKMLESETVPNRRSRRQAERNKDGDDCVAEETIGVSSISESGDLFSDMLASDTPTKLSHGRFGQLWRKEKKCWSNFSCLTGMASSPGYEAVWRTMDRAKIVGVIELKSGHDTNDSSEDEWMDRAIQNMHIVLEFRADSFVVGQIPRIISAVVAMTNGWLPRDFVAIATRPEVYMPSPPPPPSLYKLFYFRSARYHFHELASNSHGGNVDLSESFATTIQFAGSPSEIKWEGELREKLNLSRDSSINGKMESEWLLHLRDIVSPELRRRVESFEAEHLANQNQVANRVQESSILPFVESDSPAGAFSVTLHLLRDVAKSGTWPTTSDARSRVIKSPSGLTGNILATKKKNLASTFPGNSISSGSFTVVNEDIWRGGELPLGNELFPQLRKAVFELEKEIIGQTNGLFPAADGMKRGEDTRTSSTHCAINRNAQFTPHVDSGRGQGQSVSLIVGLGNYTGGDIIVEGKPYDIRYNALEFDGWNQLHWTASFKGERYSLVFFTPEVTKREERQGNMLNTFDDSRAKRLAQKHSQTIPYLPPLQFRSDSTDALVIIELLDPAKGSAYTLKHHVSHTMSSCFSLASHTCVLDVGAHIGIFSRLALAEGCSRIIAYEPEPTNFELLSRNMNTVKPIASKSSLPVIELHSAAVVSGASGSGTLVRARNENCGKQNTWRHSLEEYSQYVDRTTDLPSVFQKKTLDRFPVDCVSFFGSREEGKQNSALVPGVTFVKLDCEGAEIDILLNEEASRRSSWLDCTHLVVEWSFTKERRVDTFHKAVNNLMLAGFEVYYEGLGSWWDTPGTLWPYPNDAIVFAAMKH